MRTAYRLPEGYVWPGPKMNPDENWDSINHGIVTNFDAALVLKTRLRTCLSHMAYRA